MVTKILATMVIVFCIAMLPTYAQQQGTCIAQVQQQFAQAWQQAHVDYNNNFAKLQSEHQKRCAQLQQQRDEAIRNCQNQQRTNELKDVFQSGRNPFEQKKGWFQ